MVESDPQTYPVLRGLNVRYTNKGKALYSVADIGILLDTQTGQ